MATEGGGIIGGNALASMKARAWKRKQKGTATEPAVTASKADGEALAEEDAPVPATAVAVLTENNETSTALGRQDGIAPAAEPAPADSPPTRNAEPPAEHDGATAATGKRSSDDHTNPSNDGADSGTSSAKGSFATTKAPSAAATAIRPASVLNGGVKDSKRQAGTGDGEEQSRQQYEKGPPSPLVLTAVASLDEQVRGFGVRIGSFHRISGNCMWQNTQAYLPTFPMKHVPGLMTLWFRHHDSVPETGRCL